MKKEELENLSDADEKVRRMLASLKQVEAPKDFEFRLKARIAKASPKAYHTSYKRRLAFALPAFASIAVSAFVVINGNFFGGSQQISSLPETTARPAFAETRNTPPGEFVAAVNTLASKAPEEVSFGNSSAPTRKDEKVGLPLTAVKIPEKPKTEIPRGRSKESGGGGSKDIAWTSAETQLPNGLKPNRKVETPKDFNSDKTFSVQELLSPLGVEVTQESGKWKVKNVTQNSAAERSGIRADDVIETLDGKKLSSTPLRGKKIEVKKLGVKRGGEQVEINLQSNPK